MQNNNILTQQTDARVIVSDVLCETHSTSVLVAGFPKELCAETINGFFKKICPSNKVTIMTKGKNKFKGMVFVLFNTIEKANEFIRKDLVYKGKPLDIKLAIDTDDFIKNCLQDLRSPKKVYINKIPKHFDKKQIEEFFVKFGEVFLVNTIHRPDRSNNFAYVTFIESKSAIKCVSHKFFELDNDMKVRISYAKPNFTKRMLSKVNPVLRSYLKKIQNGKKEYHPIDFINFEQHSTEGLEDFKDHYSTDDLYNLKESFKGMKISNPINEDFLNKESNQLCSKKALYNSNDELILDNSDFGKNNKSYYQSSNTSKTIKKHSENNMSTINGKEIKPYFEVSSNYDQYSKNQTPNTQFYHGNIYQPQELDNFQPNQVNYDQTNDQNNQYVYQDSY